MYGGMIESEELAELSGLQLSAVQTKTQRRQSIPADRSERSAV